MFSNQLESLMTHERIQTTLSKAKELRPLAERLITTAKNDGVAARRKVARWIPDRTTVKKVFESLAPRFVDRPGGYTRILRLGSRKGDAAEAAILEFVDFRFEVRGEGAAQGVDVRSGAARVGRTRRDGAQGEAGGRGGGRRPRKAFGAQAGRSQGQAGQRGEAGPEEGPEPHRPFQAGSLTVRIRFAAASETARLATARRAALVWAAFLLALTSWPSPPSVPVLSNIPSIDKVVHSLLYGVEGALLYAAVAWPGRRGFSVARVLAVAGALAVFGTADETHQAFIPGRSMEGMDAVMDTAGAALGAVVEGWRAQRKVRGTT